MAGKRQKLKYRSLETKDDNFDLDYAKAKLFNPVCLWTTFGTVLLISIYFIPSVGLTFYQRWLFQRFHFPLSTVMVHMTVKFLLACCIRSVLRVKQRKARITLPWKEYIVAVAPTGLFSGIDIGFSNWGLELIKVSLYTMTKSTTIIFILGFAILFKLEKKSWSLCATVAMIATGLVLFTYKATEFNTLGFILLLFASMSSGLRWTCVQLLLQKSKMDMRNPVDMIYHMQPWMLLSLLPFAMWIEGPTIIVNCRLFRFSDYHILLDIMNKILLGAFIAFFMELSEVMVVTHTSSLTLSIAGIFKEMLMVVLAVRWNGDQLSLINVLGLIMCLFGITCHVVHKIATLPARTTNRFDYETEKHELGDYLIDDSAVTAHHLSSDSEGEHSDTQVLFDILNKHER